MLLDVAYTGTESKQISSVRYAIDPAQVRTDGGATAPRLLALQLSVPPGAPTHDLPVLALPQPSDAPATGPAMMLDLTGPTGNLAARGALDPATVVYPVDLAAGALVPKAPAPAADQPTADPSQLSLGAPAIDSNGRLLGVLINDSNGKHVLAGTSTLTDVISSVTGTSGPLMTKWQQGLSAFYATPAQFAAAQSAFSALRASYTDFGGVAPFLAAAQHQTTALAPLTQAPSGAPPTPTTTPANGGLGLSRHDSLALLIGVGVAALLVLLTLLLLLARRVRGGRPRGEEGPAADEMGLDLLPRESMYRRAIEDTPTDQMPVVPRAPTALAESAQSNGAEGSIAGRAAPSTPRQAARLMSHAAGMTDAGVRRASDPNQDNIFALEGIRLANTRPQPYGLFIVADGMGGHDHGQEASRIAIEIVTHVVRQSLSSNQPMDERASTQLLRDGVTQAHEALRQRNATDQANMGTTLTAALVVDETAHVVNVGDSRTYLMNPDVGLRQITTDHSIVASLVAAGVIRPEEIYTHPRRNQIYRSLGGEQAEVEVDTFTTSVQAGDKLLLCSDGLWEMVRDPRIEHILRATADPRQAVELLVREANANGGEDNISAVVVRMLEDMPEQPQPGVRIVVAPEDARLPSPQG